MQTLVDTRLNVAIVFGQPFVKWFTLCYQSLVCPVACLSCDVGVLWPDGWMDQDATWH